MQQIIIDLIDNHNKAVKHLETLNHEFKGQEILWVLELRHKLWREASNIVHLARGCNLMVQAEASGKIVWEE